MYVCALSIELHIPSCDSLKAKRMVLRRLLERARARYRVAAAEVGFQDQWQRTRLGFAVVASGVRHAEEVLDAVERLVWAEPEAVVLSSERHWLETD